MSATPKKSTAADVCTALNKHLNGGTCPGSGALGECPACYELKPAPGRYYAHVYIWPSGQKVLTPTVVATWCAEAGCVDIVISQHMHDPINDTYDGVCHDGALSWLVEFSL